MTLDIFLYIDGRSDYEQSKSGSPWSKLLLGSYRVPLGQIARRVQSL